MQIIFPSSVKRMLIKAAVSPWDHVEILQLEAGSGLTLYSSEFLAHPLTAWDLF